MKLRAIVQRIPKVAWALIAAQLVLLVLLLFSLYRFMQVGDSETLRANATQQRVLIDARTGVVSGLRATEPSESLAAAETPAESGFDVAPDEEEAVSTSDTPSDTEAAIASNAPSDSSAEEETEQAPSATNTDTPPTDDSALSDTEIAPEEEALEEIAGSIVNAPIAAVASVARSNQSLVTAPAPEVTETKGKLSLPARGAKKGTTPSKLYARGFVWPTDDDQKKPTIIVLVTGLGLSASSMQIALDLPAEVTLSFSPYLGKNAAWAGFARNRGHEVWSDLPAQTQDFPASDPGAYGIFSKQPSDQTLSNMQQAMAQISGFVGMSLPIHQNVLSDAELMGTVLKELESRGLLLVVPNSEAQINTLAHLVPYKKMLLVADSVLDSSPGEAFIRSQLQKLEATAKEKGVAFGVVSASPLSLRALAQWSNTTQKKGFALAPVSALLTAPKGS